MSRPPRPPEERFWKKVDVRGADECWEWQGFVAPNGYGRFDGGLAHRFSWVLANGAIPEANDYSPFGYLILHKCDNRSCVNPNHLFLGTQQDNIQDQVAKGRKIASEETRLKMVAAHTGRVFSEETKAQISKTSIATREAKRQAASAQADNNQAINR